MAHSASFFIKNIILVIAILVYLPGCDDTAPTKLQNGQLQLLTGEIVNLELAISAKEQTKGLSGKKPQDLAENQGMLFLYKRVAPRSFWMPNTLFNLDIFYLNHNLVVTKIYRNVEHHPGMDEPPAIVRLPPTNAQFVLEMHASSSLAAKIQEGHQLKWKGTKNLQEIISDIHR